jgi:hypothetical protein
VGVSWTWEA